VLFFIIPSNGNYFDYTNELFLTNALWGIRSIDVYVSFDSTTNSQLTVGYDSFTKMLTVVELVSEGLSVTILFPELKIVVPDSSNFITPESYVCTQEHTGLLIHKIHRTMKSFPFRLFHH